MDEREHVHRIPVRITLPEGGTSDLRELESGKNLTINLFITFERNDVSLCTGVFSTRDKQGMLDTISIITAAAGYYGQVRPYLRAGITTSGIYPQRQPHHSGKSDEY